METLIKPLYELKEFEDLMAEIRRQAKKAEAGEQKETIQISGCIDSQKCHMIHALGADYRYRVVVAANEQRAKEILEDYRFYERNVFYYPAKDVIFYSADVHGNAIVQSRIEVLKCLLEGEGGTIITTPDAGMDKLLPLARFQESVMVLETGGSLEVTGLSSSLVQLGYEKCGQVSARGEFAVRGGIIDIFPLTEDCPYRIELWGDEIDTIRSFDVESQRSIENVDVLKIYPATEFIMDDKTCQAGLRKIEKAKNEYKKALKEQKKLEECRRIGGLVDEFKENMNYCRSSMALEGYVNFFYDKTVSFFDYFDKDTIFFLDEPGRVMERGRAVELEFQESMTTRLEKGYILPGQVDAVYSFSSIFSKILCRMTLLFSMLDQKEKDCSVGKVFHFRVESINSYNKDFSMLLSDLKKWKQQNYRVVLLSPLVSRASRISKDLVAEGVMAPFVEKLDRELEPGEIVIAHGNVHRGFVYPMINFVVLSESDIFGAEKKKKKKRKFEGSHIQSFTELNVGDYVVHVNHGIGIYRGIEKIEMDMVSKDYVKIEYANGGELYVLATDLSCLQKYSSGQAKKPKINSLNSTEWKRTKSKARGAVKEIAEELVALYARRQQESGYEFSKDTVWQAEFEEAFPFEETEDQLKAIEDTKRDMESRKIMDRLICGDVGFGKTEIAIRAAFKAVMDGRQAAILVPTTILAQQHYNTFVQRMKDFPVNVGMLSRFRTPAQQKKTIEQLKKGEIDIVIGTHRLLSKDIKFKDLGLLVVDEEQRFGVTHKEKIKQLRTNIDVLTLSATPIPRTLHMSLVGIRDMSVLEEPPVDRLPIQTYVLEHNDEIIREAIHRELMRGGQVYYVYNRVKGIEEVAARVAELVPEAQVAYAHGQMPERQLETIMYDFINGKIDVLIATTIIETGMDISNVNTMIVDDADRLGLSQLYQLRGRIGRSNRSSFAFLMYRRDKMLREIAEKRLQAIKEFTDLGSGFKIAMRDLEIRGAGNLLGAKQHGHMESVGYDLYCKMLNEAVKTLKGEKKEEEEFETKVEIDRDAFIPSSYIKSEYQKLHIYKKIAEIETEEEFLDIQAELIDRFGELPFEVNNLLNVGHVRSLAHQAYVVKVKQEGDGIRFDMLPAANLDTAKIPPMVEAYEGRLLPKTGEKPSFFLKLPKGTESFAFYKEIKGVLKALKDCRADVS